MAKRCMVAREARRSSIIKRYSEKRKQLKETVLNPHVSDDERWEAQKRLQSLPRDASPARLRNRCSITGRPHGYYRKFGLSRNKLREVVMRGEIPGVVKASW